MRDSKDQKAREAEDPIPDWALAVAREALRILRSEQEKMSKSTKR